MIRFLYLFMMQIYGALQGVAVRCKETLFNFVKIVCGKKNVKKREITLINGKPLSFTSSFFYPTFALTG